ncbi:hypothetical protein P3T36_006261, partial [Kitasatospora sp. MAP12-15]
GHNPSRAAGAVTFNVLTTIFTGGEAGGVEGAGKAGAVAKTLSVAGKVGKVIDPMTYVFKGAGFGISKVSDVMSGLKGITDIKIPEINVDGAFALPEGAVHLPDGGIRLPEGTAVPEGAIRTADGGIKVPEGTVELPPGTVKLDLGGRTEFLDPHGNVYDHDGNVLQRGTQAPHEGANLPAGDHPPVKLDTPVKVRTPELVGVGARDGDRAVNLGSDLSHPHDIPDHTPTTHTPDHTPGGHAPEGPRASHEPPGGANHGNHGGPGHTTAGHDGGPGHTTGGHDSHPTPGGHDSHPGLGGHQEPPSPAAHGWDHPSTEEPRPFERGGATEQEIRDVMRGSKVKPGDLDKALANLADHPAGQEMADMIGSGRFKGMTNFDQVVSSFSQKNAMSGGVEQLRLADRLQRNGVTDISFEIKKETEIKPGVMTGPRTDMDVMARDTDGTVYGYQFKEIANPMKVANKMWQNMGQLADSGADVKVFVVDTKGSMADMLASGIEKDLTRIHNEQGVIVVLRVEDGTLMYPPGARFMPGGQP